MKNGVPFGILLAAHLLSMKCEHDCVWLLWLLQTELLMKLLSCGSVVTELKVLSCVRLWDVCGASGLTGLVLPYIYEPACLFQYFITVWFYCWQFASIRYLAIFRIFTVLTDWKKHQNTDPKWKTFFLLKNSNLIILAELVKIVPRTLRECFSNYCVTFRVITLTSEVITPQKLLDTRSVLWLPSHVLCTCLIWPIGERHATSDTNNMHKVTEQNGIKHRGPHTTSPHKPFIHIHQSCK